MARLTLLMLGCVAGAFLVSTAGAEPGAPAADVDTALGTATPPGPTATSAEGDADALAWGPEALVDRGIEQRKAGDDRAALESFQRAYELGSSPRALAQLALAEQALGRWLDAYEHLTRALRSDHAWIREHSGELEAALADITSELGSLEVTCNVQGAEIYVDGRRLGTTPSPAAFRLVAGESVLQVVAAGYFSLTRQVQVEAGGLSRVEVTLTPRASADPVELPRPSSAANSDRSAIAPAAEPGPWRDALMYGSIGLSGLGVATGVTGYVMREVNVKIYNDDTRCDLRTDERRSQECPEAADAWRLGENLMIGGFAAAGVFGALGLYLWLDRPDDHGSTEVACSPLPSGLACFGAF